MVSLQCTAFVFFGVSVSAGTDLRALLEGALPEGMEFDERESAIIDLAVGMADSIEALEDLVADQGLTVVGSQGQERFNPAVTELRQQRATLSRMLGQLRMPDGAGGVVKDVKKQRAAETMHAQRRAKRGAGRLHVIGGG